MRAGSTGAGAGFANTLQRWQAALPGRADRAQGRTILNSTKTETACEARETTARHETS